MDMLTMMMVLVTGAVALLLLAELMAKPRKLRGDEQGFERDAFPLYMGRPGMVGSVASLVGAAAASVAVASTIRYREGEFAFGCEIDVVVPWWELPPWHRADLQQDLVRGIELVRPMGVAVRARVVWR